MKLRRIVLPVIVAGGLLAILVFYGLGAAPLPANQVSIDSTTVDQLSRAYFSTHPMDLAATADVTGTRAAMLAAELLLSSVNFNVNLPAVIK